MTVRGSWHITGTIASLAPILLLAAIARAADPVAIVEDVSGKQAAVQFMDYVTTGTVIRLDTTDNLILGYMRSCWRETIRGGVVTVGAEQSRVTGGTVKRQKVECDGGRLRLSTAQAGESGVMVLRGRPVFERAAASAPAQRTLYGLSPFIAMPGGGRLVIERLDQPGERHEVEIEAGQAGRDGFYDFAKEGRWLSAGGLYRAFGPSDEIVFKVHARAKRGQAPIVGRLLKLQGAERGVESDNAQSGQTNPGGGTPDRQQGSGGTAPR